MNNTGQFASDRSPLGLKRITLSAPFGITLDLGSSCTVTPLLEDFETKMFVLAISRPYYLVRRNRLPYPSVYCLMHFSPVMTSLPNHPFVFK